MTPEPEDLSGFSMLDLFRLEIESQTTLLIDGLLRLERDPTAIHEYEALMRAAHSLKGAARMVNIAAAVQVAHAMEDCFIAARDTNLPMPVRRIDLLLRGVDLLKNIAQDADAAEGGWARQNESAIETFLRDLKSDDTVKPEATDSPATLDESVGASNDGVEDQNTSDEILTANIPTIQVPDEPTTLPSFVSPTSAEETTVAGIGGPRGHIASGEVEPRSASTETDHVVRVSAANLNRLLGLAGETVVASRWLNDFTADLQRLKRLQDTLSGSLQTLQDLMVTENDERLKSHLNELHDKNVGYRQVLAQRLAEVELFDRQFNNLSQRVYQEVLDCRMRPFSDGIQGFARMVRDVAHELGKAVRFEVQGEATPVDRDMLERLKAPLGHLLRNAVDHGIETREMRRSQGRSDEGLVRLEARHHAGMLFISVSDDGSGIDLEVVREAVIRKGLAAPEVGAQLTEAELLEFLFLPGFTMKEAITNISGRGVGLDAVQTMVKEVGGTVSITSSPGAGTTFQLQLPLTLSVMRTLVVEIAGEPYAFPLTRIVNALKLREDKIQSVEGRQHFTFNDQQVGLVTAHQVLESSVAFEFHEELPVIVLGDKANLYGLAIDRFLGERELVVRSLDPRLGKVQNIDAAALMPDQTPVLIVDVEDMIRSIENLVSGGRLSHLRGGDGAGTAKQRKRVLVVDDSLTVRELERKLIDSRGYEVEVAVDGMDAWNAVRTGHYDLVVTDVDMPRMDGIELVTLIKKDSRLHELPVMIVSYKDREDDRRRGLDAGADYYLAKGNFHDEALLQAVEDLIGASIS